MNRDPMEPPTRDLTGASEQGRDGRSAPDAAAGSIRIGILSHPAGGASATPPLMSLIRVIGPIARELTVVAAAESCTVLESESASSGAIRIQPVQGLISSWEARTRLWRRLLNFTLTQVRAASLVGRTGSGVDLWIFYIDGQNQILPMLIGRLYGRPVLLLLAYSAVDTLKVTSPVMAAGARILGSLGYSLSDRIAVASPSFIDGWGLGRWRGKVRVAHEHFIDLDDLAIGPPVEDRAGLIGFAGRFAPEKGVVEFLEAVRLLHAREPDLRFLLIGDGPLRKVVDEAVTRGGLQECLTVTGWIPNEMVRSYLRDLKLLVVPSYTESGPMVAYEALAVGTPVLITRTGLVASLIEDGNTGFLLRDPSAESIVEGVSRALATPSLEKVSTAGRELVSREFSLERARGRLHLAIRDAVSDE